MSDYFKCAWCGKSFKKGFGAELASIGTLGISNLGKKYCSKACEVAADGHKQASSSHQKQAVNEFQSSAAAPSVSVERNSAVELERTRLNHELKVAGLKETSNLIERISSIEFGDTPTEIAHTLDFCITTASSIVSETFDDITWEKEREKFNRSEKVVNAAIKKADLGISKLRITEPHDKAVGYLELYREQLREVKIQHIRRKYELKIKEAKPDWWIWFVCIFFFPALVFPLYKTYVSMIELPRKRDKEIAQL